MMDTSEMIVLADSIKGRYFREEIIGGLQATPKNLPSKYFYDAAGDQLFQQIMHCPEYYLTDCEQEILSRRAAAISGLIKLHAGNVDIIELGPGDASKSLYLLRELSKEGTAGTYFPIDISADMISTLKNELSEKLPQLVVNGLNGEYFDMLERVNELSGKKKIILFLGANIGNFSIQEAQHFCQQLSHYMQDGDLLLTGFDLKKNPSIIRNAYNDKQGLTKAFNLNLLKRINREMNADFNPAQFDHYPTYDPHTGTCKSYLISLANQVVRINREAEIPFKENEPIYMEISQKYSPEETDRLAVDCGFTPLIKFFDHKKWFADCLWQYGSKR